MAELPLDRVIVQRLPHGGWVVLRDDIRMDVRREPLFATGEMRILLGYLEVHLAGPGAEPVAALAVVERCSTSLRLQGKAYPRTCAACGLGPCHYPGFVSPAEISKATEGANGAAS